MLSELTESDPIGMEPGLTPLRICLLGYRSNPFSGGQGIYINYLSRALVDAGHRVDVISGEPYPDLDNRVRLIKLPGLNLFEAKNHVTALRPRHLLSYTDFFEWFSMLTGGFPEPYTFGRRVAKYLRRHNTEYDIIHDNQSLCYGVLELQKKGLPVVTTIHHPITSDRDIALSSAVGWKLRLLIRRWHSFLRMQTKVARKLDHIVTVSNQSRTDIAKAFGIDTQRIHLIPNGVDLNVFKPIPEVSRKPFQLMTTASADVPLKGLEYLLRALVQLQVSYPQIHLLIVGKLKDDGVTRELIATLDIARRLTFVSNITTEQMVRHYAESSIAVVPSVYEGFGLPAAEAMATGTPVVSTDGGALPEVIGDAGLLVPVRDSTKLAEAIDYLLKNDAVRKELGNKGMQRIAAEFSWHQAAQQFTELYRTIGNTTEPNHANAYN